MLLLLSCFCLSDLPPRKQLHVDYQQDGAGESQTLYSACEYFTMFDLYHKESSLMLHYVSLFQKFLS